MHEIVDSWSSAEFQFDWEFDTGMGFGGENTLYVERLIPIATEERGVFNRTFYFENNPKRHMRAYADKLSLDPQYRTHVVEGSTDWQKVREIFSEVEMHNTDYSDAMEEVFRGIYKYISSGIDSLYYRFQTRPLELLNEFIQKFGLSGVHPHNCAALNGKFACTCDPNNPKAWQTHQTYHVRWLKGEPTPQQPATDSGDRGVLP